MSDLLADGSSFWPQQMKISSDLPDTVVEVELEHGDHQLYHLLRVVREMFFQLPATHRDGPVSNPVITKRYFFIIILYELT